MSELKKLNLYTTYFESDLLEIESISRYLLPLEGFSDHTDRLYTLQQLPDFIEILQSKGKKAYLWLNRFFFDDEIESFKTLLKKIPNLGVDGIAYMDFGVHKLLEELNITCEKIYISDPSVTNSEDLLLVSQFNDKVLLGRELTTEELVEMAQVLPTKSMVSIYGHQLMSISRRPLLTAYGEFVDIEVSQNKVYTLKEQRRQEPYFLYEDATSASIFDGRVLLDFEDFIALTKAGVTDFILEGFNRSTSEIKVVAQLYKQVFNQQLSAQQALQQYTEKYPHQEITTGLRQIKTSDRKVSE